MNRIKKLRNEKCLTQKVLSNSLNVSQSTIAAWELSERQPTLKQICKMADFFKVSIDFLVGRSDKP